jgi:hypothetical protein
MDVTRRQFVGTGLVAAAAFFGLPQIASAEGWKTPSMPSPAVPRPAPTGSP